MKTLILKEIREIITNTRSLFVLLICALLIPFGLYVSTKEYELKKEAFKDAKQLYEERSKNKKERDFIAEGYIPPAPLSIISNGLSDFLPDKISTNANQEWKLLVDYEMFNPIALLFGKIDLYYIITIILSLLVLMFTFNSIIGEKENGTLKLIVANAVPRWKIIIAKITGSYLAFLISFLVGIILGLVLVVLTTSVPILAQDYMTPFLTILIISLLFLFILFNMGLLLSIITRNSGSAITASLLVWVFFAIIIPKVSPMISQMIYPIDTQAVVNKKIKMKQDEIIAEYNKSCDELMARLLSDHGLNAESLNGWNMWDNPDAKAALDEYDAQIGPIGQRLSDRVVNEIGKIEKDYRNEQLFQQGICKNISRISPISCFTYLINDITNTGLKEIQNLESNARQFTLDAQSDYYSYINKNFKQYHIGYNYFSGIFGKVDDEHLKVPTLNTYYYPSITSSLTSNWIDLLLICFYALLFFALSVFQFIRYDVR